MPHFIIDCSENLFESIPPETLLNAVYETVEASGLFAPNDIKVRLNPARHYRLAPGKDRFLHVFAYIMEGRTAEKKAALSRAVITKLNVLLPGFPILSMNVADFERASYCNKALIDPANSSGDRHFGM